MAYTPYNNAFYMQDLQNMRDRIDRQMQQLQQNQMQQPVTQPITQNFQLAPNPTNNDLEAKYAESNEQVKNTFVIKTGIFVNKDFSTLWIKDVTGKIRTFNTEEVVELDEKDKEIIALKKEIQSMKEMVKDATQYSNSVIDETDTVTKPTRISTGKRTNQK